MPDQVGKQRGGAGVLAEVQRRIPGIEDALKVAMPIAKAAGRV